MIGLPNDPFFTTPLPNRPAGPPTQTINLHESALAWFELHLMAQAPTTYTCHEAHSLLAGGLAVNRFPSWNSEFLPSWLLQRIVQGPMGKQIIHFMNKIAPKFPYNQPLLQETELPPWTYNNINNISVVNEDETFVVTWLPPTEFM